MLSRKTRNLTTTASAMIYRNRFLARINLLPIQRHLIGNSEDKERQCNDCWRKPGQEGGVS